MEEKERYEVHIYDDVCVDLYNNGVLDKSINDTYKLEKLLNQQDKELSKLRANYQQVKEENSQLKQQLAITEKALELACEEITGSCEYCSYKTRIECPVEADCLNEKINYFKYKAKEIINGYKPND